MFDRNNSEKLPYFEYAFGLHWPTATGHGGENLNVASLLVLLKEWSFSAHTLLVQ